MTYLEYGDTLPPMKKQLLEKELEKLLVDVNEHQKKCDLELATAEFLRNEADKLLATIKNPNTNDKKKVDLLKKMESLQRRIVIEQNIVERGIAKLSILERKMESIKEVIESGTIEE